ncbi:transglycosylase domain-containing protein [Sphingosinicella humi]|uniref:Penicillin-binding protein n=1 Tax=Allosphingosinicella humi TaxID=2068657 RepID=A0A2U2J001_9SPHN|nr:transglycosylase domain-containing protein [Sphingosinicella humi]PWG01611.1 penicillin-binding protein [Sphingosinicella humi]
MLFDQRPNVAPAEPAGPQLAVPVPPEGEAPRPRRHWKIAAALLAAFLLLFAYLAVTAPLSKSLQPIAAPSLTLLSADGTPIARRGAITDDPVSVADLPAHVPNAFLAIEDRRFHNHSGIDPWGILRAAARNALAGGVVEGGSTITQQLAKLAFLSSDQTATRKLREALIAVWLEAWLSKEEILSRYLSSVYFGDNVYGLRAASHHYFDRPPEDLTVGQAAMLAGLMKAPSRLNPTSNLEGARERTQVVLNAMVEAGMLTAEEAADVPPVKLDLGPAKDLPKGSYFADWVFPEARAAVEWGYGEQTIETTLEDDLQRQAVNAVRRANLNGAQVALVAMRPDGRVVAMIGGKSYRKSPFNRATQAVRQPGSAFKLFVYLAALRAGMTPESMILDEPVTIDEWTPENSDDRYDGLITLREAFARSSNVAAVRLQERIGRQNVIEAARDLGISTELKPTPSLALGTSGTKLIEMVAAYAAVANGNYPVRPHGLPAAEAGWFESMRSRFRRFNERSTWPMLLDLLWSAANDGTGRAAALRVETFGKTGTTQDNRDAIFIGFAGDLVTGVWVGNDDNSPLAGNIHGGGLPARIWRDFMSNAIDLPPARRPTRQPQREEPEAPPTDGPRLIIPPADVGGLEMGVEITPDTVTITAEPPAGQDDDAPTEPVDIPIVAPPPPVPPEEDGEPPFAL